MAGYAVVRRFLPSVELSSIGDRSVEIDDQYELGLTFGTDPAPSLFGLALPRLGIAYRWGEGLSQWRFNLGFPF